MDFLIALKGNEPALVLLNLRKLLILFAIMGNNEYVDYILHHLFLFDYHVGIDHPHLQLFLSNLLSLVGEDIELGNRALSHCSVRNSRRSDHTLLNNSYRLLNYMYQAGIQFGDEMREFKEIVKGSRRYEINDEKLLEKASTFFKGLIQSLKDGTFKHYEIPHRMQKTSKRVPASEMKHHEMKVLFSQNVETKIIAETHMEVRVVRYIASYNCHHFIEVSMKTMFSKRRKWNVATQLSRETLEKLANNDPKFIHPQLLEYVRTLPPLLDPSTGPRLNLRKRRRDDQKDSVVIS